MYPWTTFFKFNFTHHTWHLNKSQTSYEKRNTYFLLSIQTHNVHTYNMHTCGLHLQRAHLVLNTPTAIYFLNRIPFISTHLISSQAIFFQFVMLSVLWTKRNHWKKLLFIWIISILTFLIYRNVWKVHAMAEGKEVNIHSFLYGFEN